MSSKKIKLKSNRAASKRFKVKLYRQSQTKRLLRVNTSALNNLSNTEGQENNTANDVLFVLKRRPRFVVTRSLARQRHGLTKRTKRSLQRGRKTFAFSGDIKISKNTTYI